MCTHILVVTLLRSNAYFEAIIALKIGNRLAIIKIVKKNIHVLMLFNIFLLWLSGRVIDSIPRGRGFEPHCFVVLEQNRIILA